MRRPQSVHEVVEWSTDSGSFHYQVADFIDQFRIRPQVEMIAEEPRRVAGRFEGGDVCDAYIAAVALSLAREIEARPPGWVWDESRKLQYPWFASPGPAIRAMLLWESPAPFRERNLFVSANALSRA